MKVEAVVHHTGDPGMSTAKKNKKAPYPDVSCKRLETIHKACWKLRQLAFSTNDSLEASIALLVSGAIEWATTPASEMVDTEGLTVRVKSVVKSIREGSKPVDAIWEKEP